jgi:hypothetical protein
MDLAPLHAKSSRRTGEWRISSSLFKRREMVRTIFLTQQIVEPTVHIIGRLGSRLADLKQLKN